MTAPTERLPAVSRFTADALPRRIEAGRYHLSFARTEEELDRILRLRFEVFNLELGEGLDEAYRTGRDEDRLDRCFHHLMITTADGAEVVGTYRMQTARMAAANLGFYSAAEFDLSGVPLDVLSRSVEVGRACVARAHRNGRVLHLLWRGLASYLQHQEASCLFGCCSITTQDPAVGVAAHEWLAREGHMHDRIAVEPLPGVRCGPTGVPAAPVELPALFQSYLNLGAKAWGPPAIDREFKTVDFLVGLDVRTMAPHVLQGFLR
jgi:putative hemolysin